ncbi:hypothetical protein B0A48_15676 [Cryoendolithus antarcticus]|uniref:Tudor domain-containing protein n=1 Tax=Cryoendolithus antarcticus TaxID=1507870 RepID=A0A1V8SH95_9PEZI|nr:hypothetical protein B0A48_15676 [Cryoendolithus antarcticus]
MSSHDGRTLEELQAEIANCEELVSACDEVLALDPDDETYVTEKANALAEITVLKSLIATRSAPPPPAEDAPPPPPKWDPTKHPKFRKASPEAPPPPPADDTPVIYNVKDVVLAKWSGDKQFYEAVITSKLGSPTDPVYTVTFKIDNSTETKRSHEVRAMPGKKRKAESQAQPATPTLTHPPSNHSIITAAPTVDKTLIPKYEPSKVSDGPTRMQPEKKKLKGVKPMEAKKNNWQNFQAVGPKKVPVGAAKQKASQFRTPDAPNARVGVQGSGKPMQKDPARAKWVAERKGEDEDD